MQISFWDHKIEEFRKYLHNDEKSPLTSEKYVRDILKFKNYIGSAEISKASVLAYKKMLSENYAVVSANSMLAALNHFFRFCGRQELCVKQLRIQKKAFCSADKKLSKAEYRRLVRVSENKRDERLSLLIQTICATGIRVSELVHITVEAVEKGQAIVSCKGKIRTVLIVSSLRKKLLRYTRSKRIVSGPIFITRSGKPLNRCNIWREMKALCTGGDVSPSKVFPHNLRHLFARTFYGMEKDIAKLADILGHTNINTTRIYIVTSGEEHKRKMENMHLIV